MNSWDVLFGVVMLITIVGLIIFSADRARSAGEQHAVSGIDDEDLLQQNDSSLSLSNLNVTMVEQNTTKNVRLWYDG